MYSDHDYLIINDIQNNKSINAIRLSKSSGNLKGKVISSIGNQMMITFKTNQIGTKKGFKAYIHFNHIKPECLGLLNEIPTNDVTNYSEDFRVCSWHITMPHHLYIKFQILLHKVSFDIQAETFTTKNKIFAILAQQQFFMHTCNNMKVLAIFFFYL